MILIVCLNLAVDQIVHVRNLRVGEVHRSIATWRQAGSKGVNVARVLKVLDAPCLLAGFLGGEKGKFIGESLEKDGIDYDPSPIAEESRTCFILHDEASHRQTVINEPGPRIQLMEYERFVVQFRTWLEKIDSVVISGSLPPGLPEETYAQLITWARDAGKQTLLDCSGDSLQPAVEAKPHLLKVNHLEAAALLNEPVESPERGLQMIDRLIRLGPSVVMITFGGHGAVLASAGKRCRLTPPQIRAKNSVGSGDAAMAGLAAELGRGHSLEQAGILAMAAGAANALHGGGHCTAEEIAAMKKQVICELIA